MPATTERAYVGIPADLNAALRERLRITDGPDIADAPLSILLRYTAALAAGIPRTQALRYARALPRGHTWRESNYPSVRELKRQ